jgi:integrase
LEFERLRADAPDNPDGLIFGIIDEVKRSFTAARSKAGLNDVRFHDLRHTAATRLVGAHIPLSEVGRVLGHSQANTTSTRTLRPQNAQQQHWMPSMPKQSRPRRRQSWCTEVEAVLNFDSE